MNYAGLHAQVLSNLCAKQEKVTSDHRALVPESYPKECPEIVDSCVRLNTLDSCMSCMKTCTADALASHVKAQMELIPSVVEELQDGDGFGYLSLIDWVYTELHALHDNFSALWCAYKAEGLLSG